MEVSVDEIMEVAMVVEATGEQEAEAGDLEAVVDSEADEVEEVEEAMADIESSTSTPRHDIEKADDVGKDGTKG